MRKTTTKTKEVWSVCRCGGKESCFLCKGTGKFISETFTETIIEEIPGKNIEEDVIDADEVLPELEHK
jgi:hypothetical protein